MKTVINPDYILLKPLIENLEHHFQKSTEILYDQRNQIKVINYDGEDYVVKRFKVPNIINRLVYRYFRPSKAKRSYEYSLKIGSIFCPAPIAYIEEYKTDLLSTSYFVSKRYEYDFTIRPVLLDRHFNKQVRQQVLEEFADFSYELHQNHILHRDYSYGNILIKRINEQGNDKQFKFKIIDVNRMQFRALTLDERLENFARLSANDDAMEIIINRYASQIQEPLSSTLIKAKKLRDDFMYKRKVKNKLRGR